MVRSIGSSLNKTGTFCNIAAVKRCGKALFFVYFYSIFAAQFFIHIAQFWMTKFVDYMLLKNNEYEPTLLHR
jgi:hypothetical protein